MVNKSTNPWRLECHRAFQTDPSWYEAYWYPEPAPQRPSFFSRAITSLAAAFQRLSVLMGKMAGRQPMTPSRSWFAHMEPR